MSTETQTPKATILVVDDTPQNLDILVSLLSHIYRVKVANSGPKALRIAKGQQKPDLILLDIMMPEMDGHEVLRELKKDAETKDIPVIFCTAMHEVQDEEKGLAMGAVDYVTKPISPPLVMARIDTHLKLSNRRRALEEQVKERTHELHSKNVKLEEEVRARKIVEAQLSFQLGVQKEAASMAAQQMKSLSPKEAQAQIISSFQRALLLDRMAIYGLEGQDWKVLASSGEDGVPHFSGEKVCSSDLEGWVSLSSGDDGEPLELWYHRRGKFRDEETWDQALDHLLDMAKLLVNASRLRQSIASFGLDI
jgi:CheY-like chemotaxis protein